MTNCLVKIKLDQENREKSSCIIHKSQSYRPAVSLLHTYFQAFKHQGRQIGAVQVKPSKIFQSWNHKIKCYHNAFFTVYTNFSPAAVISKVLVFMLDSISQMTLYYAKLTDFLVFARWNIIMKLHINVLLPSHKPSPVIPLAMVCHWLVGY